MSPQLLQLYTKSSRNVLWKLLLSLRWHEVEYLMTEFVIDG